jgi:VWFA-related protein
MALCLPGGEQMKNRLLLFAAFVLMPFTLLAQQQDSTPTFQVKSNLVVVDASVVDKNGKPINDLQKDDFRIYESGVEQSINGFDPPSTHQIAPGLSSTSITSMTDVQKLAPNSAITVIVLDEINTPFMDMAYVRSALKKYIQKLPEKLLQPTSIVAATDSSFNQIQDYTLSRQQLYDAIVKYKGAYSFELDRLGSSNEGAVIRLAKTIAALQQIANATLGHKGRKNLLWIGKGFPNIDLRDEPNRQVELVTGLAERTINLLRDAHVTINTIDPAMANSSSDFDQSANTFTSEVHLAKDPFNGTVSFNTFAPETGGIYFSLNNDIGGKVEESIEEGNSFYTLSYVPSEASVSTQTYKQINIQVSRPNLIVHSLQGYYFATPPKPLVTEKQTKKDIAFYLGTAAVSKMTFTGINFVVNPSTNKPNSYQVHVNTADLTWNLAKNGEERSQLMMAVVALDDKNRPIASVVHETTALLPVERPLSSVPFVPMDVEAKVPQNAVRLRFVIRDSASGQMGSFDLGIKGKK